MVLMYVCREMLFTPYRAHNSMYIFDLLLAMNDSSRANSSMPSIVYITKAVVAVVVVGNVVFTVYANAVRIIRLWWGLLVCLFNAEVTARCCCLSLRRRLIRVIAVV